MNDCHQIVYFKKRSTMKRAELALRPKRQHSVANPPEADL